MRHNNDFIELEVKTAAQPLQAGSPCLWIKKGVTVLSKVIDPDSGGEIGLLLHHRGKEKYIWNTGDPTGYVLLPCPVFKVKEKLQQPNLCRTTNSPRSFGNEDWVPLQVKNQPAEVLVEGEGSIEWVVKDAVINTSYDHTIAFRNKDCNFHEYFLTISEYMCDHY